MDCIFCKIIAGQIPSHKVYEDDQVLAFLDINPVNHGHTLVIPKSHVGDIEEATGEQLSSLALAIKKVGRSIKEGLGVEGYNVTENNGSVAGQIIPHLHFHVIPRQAGDGLKLWPPRGNYQGTEAEDILQKIKIN
ncbi:HIT family protein [Candidatus Parcubacteria bacterium]|nr:MAG: HIT family protein [Candidatus Parcubacteria bacterium]